MTAVVPRNVERQTAIDAAHLDLRDDFWCACVLLMLSECAADSHELSERLRRVGQLGDDPGRVSRALVALEDGGLVRAVGDAAACRGGRSYGVTGEGAARLALAGEELRGALVIFARFLARCGERLELPPTR